MMMEEGKVRLTDPLSKFIPELKGLKVAVAQPNSGPPPAAGAQAGSQLLHGTGRSRDHDSRSADPHVWSRQRADEQRRRAPGGAQGEGERSPTTCRALAAAPLEFQPGTRWAYSAQAGFDALARVVEVVSGLPFDQFTRQRLFDPLGMKDTFFYPAEGNPRMVTRYTRSPEGNLLKQTNPNFMNGAYFSGGGGLFSTAEDYLQFGLMLLNGGQLNGKRLLSPRLVELMSSVVAPDTLPGRPRGESYGLSVRVVSDPVGRNTFLSQGSFGWSGAYGTHFWVDPKEKVVGVLMTQTPNQEIRGDFENAVMQAIVGEGTLVGTH